MLPVAFDCAAAVYTAMNRSRKGKYSGRMSKEPAKKVNRTWEPKSASERARWKNHHIIKALLLSIPTWLFRGGAKGQRDDDDDSKKGFFFFFYSVLRVLTQMITRTYLCRLGSIWRRSCSVATRRNSRRYSGRFPSCTGRGHPVCYPNKREKERAH